jgi:phosphopantetheinyl transferase (holo-ACP synthase)
MKTFFCAEFASKGTEMTSINEFLSNLLNSALSDDEELYLTSAQRARFLSWCDRNAIKLELKQLQGKFRIVDLNMEISGGHSSSKNNSYISSGNLGLANTKSRVGIDIQSINEMFPLSTEIDYSQISSIYSIYEIDFSKSSNNPRATLAGLFSLKESLLKAGVTPASYVEIEITHTADGAPIFYGYEVSISHSGDFVTSIAMRSK